MRIGIIITTDKAGRHYVDNGAECTPLKSVDIATLKDRVDAITVKGLNAKVGKETIRMDRALLLTNNGLVKRRRLPEV